MYGPARLSSVQELGCLYLLSVFFPRNDMCLQELYVPETGHGCCVLSTSPPYYKTDSVLTDAPYRPTRGTRVVLAARHSLTFHEATVMPAAVRSSTPTRWSPPIAESCCVPPCWCHQFCLVPVSFCWCHQFALYPSLVRRIVVHSLTLGPIGATHQVVPTTTPLDDAT